MNHCELICRIRAARAVTLLLREATPRGNAGPNVAAEAIGDMLEGAVVLIQAGLIDEKVGAKLNGAQAAMEYLARDREVMVSALAGAVAGLIEEIRKDFGL